ncbi:MAG: hypothetical protein WCG27_07960 [Pseudomonadota bacterium]
MKKTQLLFPILLCLAMLIMIGKSHAETLNVEDYWSTLRLNIEGKTYTMVDALSKKYIETKDPEIIDQLITFTDKVEEYLKSNAAADYIIRTVNDLNVTLLARQLLLFPMEVPEMLNKFKRLSMLKRFEVMSQWGKRKYTIADLVFLDKIPAFTSAAKEISKKAGDPDYVLELYDQLASIISTQLSIIRPPFEGSYEIHFMKDENNYSLMIFSPINNATQIVVALSRNPSDTVQFGFESCQLTKPNQLTCMIKRGSKIGAKIAISLFGDKIEGVFYNPTSRKESAFYGKPHFKTTQLYQVLPKAPEASAIEGSYTGTINGTNFKLIIKALELTPEFGYPLFSASIILLVPRGETSFSFDQGVYFPAYGLLTLMANPYDPNRTSKILIKFPANGAQSSIKAVYLSAIKSIATEFSLDKID